MYNLARFLLQIAPINLSIIHTCIHFMDNLSSLIIILQTNLRKANGAIEELQMKLSNQKNQLGKEIQVLQVSYIIK